MKKILFILLSLAVPVLLLAEEPVREWKSQSGQTIFEGTLDSPRDSDDPGMVYFLKRYRVPFNQLSKADQEYVIKARKGSRSVGDNDIQTEVAPRGMEVVPSNNRYALLIGVNEYAAPIKSLNYCVQDMTYLAECFKKLGFQESNIFLVTDNSPAERRPTGANIRNQIETITNMMRSGDQLIVAFSGHGVMVDGKNYLCPSDTNLENKDSIVSRDWVFDQLEKSKAKQKIFFVDACRNEISFSGGKAVGQAKTVEDPIGADTHGFILIASCDKNQQSWEHPDISHGVFTYYLGKGIAGEAADKDGYVYIMGLFNYASSNTKSYVFRKFNKLQVPTFGLRDTEGTDFCIGKLTMPTSVVDNKAGEGKPPVVPPSAGQGSITPPIVQPPSGSFNAGDRKTFTINGVEFAFRYCPAGEFLMGSPDWEQGRRSVGNNSEKQHKVTLTKGFWMMETEVTQKQWNAIMGDLGDNPSKFKGDNLPVENISWNDCQAFCKKCSELGLPLRLPTEAQWEYACRTGKPGVCVEKPIDVAWFKDNSRGTTHPVGTKKPNQWNLYDMYGNVAEWCQDFIGAYSSEDEIDPVGPLRGRDRVCRGGAWISFFRTTLTVFRPATRGFFEPKYRGPELGFRCVLGSAPSLNN